MLALLPTTTAAPQHSAAALALCSSEQLAGLKGHQRERVNAWAAEVVEMEKLPVRRRGAFKVGMAQRLGVSKSTLAERLKRWEESRDPQAFLDNRKGKSGLTTTFTDFFKQLCGEQGRVSAQAIRVLHDMWRDGHHIPGFGTWQEYWIKTYGNTLALPQRCGDFLPDGLSAHNLYKHLPNKFALTAMRQGRAAAIAQFGPLVLGTRLGLYVGAYISMDDLWHDCEINVRGVNKEGQRPLEVSALDIFSAHKFRWQAWPMLENDDGTRTTIRGRYTRMLIAAILHVDGYSRRGTTFVVENAGVAIPKPLEELITHVTGGLVRVHRGSIGGKPAISGHYHGQSKGNPRHKPHQESSHHPHHNRMTDKILNPGLIGSNSRLNAPEEHYGRDRANTHLIKTVQRHLAAGTMTPAEAAKVQLPILGWHEWYQLATRAYHQLAMESEHALEGWEEAELMHSEFRLGPGQDWQPMSALDEMPPNRRAAVEAYITLPGMHNVRRKSRLEVYREGARDLVRVDMSAAWLILDQDAQPCTVTNRRLLEYTENKRKFHFIGPIRTASGQSIDLRRGATYRLVVNAFYPSKALVGDTDGRLLGVVDEWERKTRMDLDGLAHSYGRVAAATGDELADLERRHWDQADLKRRQEEHNARLFAGKPVTAEDRAREAEKRRIAKSVTPSEMIEALTPAPTPEEDEPEDDDFSSLIGGPAPAAVDDEDHADFDSLL
ncbi:hypothetical protein DB346_08620 [Verrucomicrobia bacterium LW23]|nr:hypothetical protein DB346_08620 [Verrucomicrobia bacterium LW23]